MRVAKSAAFERAKTKMVHNLLTFRTTWHQLGTRIKKHA